MRLNDGAAEECMEYLVHLLGGRPYTIITHGHNKLFVSACCGLMSSSHGPAASFIGSPTKVTIARVIQPDKR
jgi:hypothetical protein